MIVPAADDREAAIKAAEKLLHLVENDELTLFDKREAKALQAMARLWLAFESFGALAGALKAFVLAAGSIVVAYLAIKNHFADWIREVAK